VDELLGLLCCGVVYLVLIWIVIRTAVRADTIATKLDDMVRLLTMIEKHLRPEAPPREEWDGGEEP
jgi:hypothetical protein